MTDNDNIAQTQAEPEMPKKKGLSMFAIMRGEFLNVLAKNWLLVLMVLMGGLALVYCRYKVESLSKAKIEAIERRDYLRETHIDLQKRYQETIKISKIAQLLDSTGVGITAGPPFEI